MSAEKYTDPTPSATAFGAFLATYGGERCEKMMGSTRAASALFSKVMTVSKAKLPRLPRNRNYETRELCADIWSSLSPRQAVCAGLCMAFIARRSVLPIRMHKTRSGKGRKRYWISISPAGTASAPRA